MLKDSFKHKWVLLFLIPAWVFISFFVAQLIAKSILWIVSQFDFSFLASLDDTVLNASISALVYSLTVIIVIFAPLIIQRTRTTRLEMGINRLPTWTDIFLSPAGLVIYFVLSSLLIIIIKAIVPGFDLYQTQNTGFNNLNTRYEIILAFATLVIVAPIAEELLFRGYLLGKLMKYVPIWLAVIVTSVLFGFAHGAWNLAIDTFALSVILCLLRLMTGNVWSSMLLHMMKNGIAFYFLFINPTFLDTLVK